MEWTGATDRTTSIMFINRHKRTTSTRSAKHSALRRQYSYLDLEERYAKQVVQFTQAEAVQHGGAHDTDGVATLPTRPCTHLGLRYDMLFTAIEEIALVIGGTRQWRIRGCLIVLPKQHTAHMVRGKRTEISMLTSKMTSMSAGISATIRCA